MDTINNFTWTLDKTSITSAGIYDLNNVLVRSLWSMKKLNAGTINSSWDGFDDFGNLVASGSYNFKVTINGATYLNIGTIGNTGLPSTTYGHIPFYMEGVAIDDNNFIYTVHDWNEAGHNIKKYSPVDGSVVYHSAHGIDDALLKGIAVEPDGSYAYVTAYGAQSNDSVTERSKSRFYIYRVNLSPTILNERDRVVPFTQQGRMIKVYNGNDSGYPNEGYPTPAYPPNATEADKDLMAVPLISVAVYGNNVYVTDAIGDRILAYDKVTGNFQKKISGLPSAVGLCITPNGKIWVGHSHNKVSVFDLNGNLLATPIVNMTEVRAISVRGSTLAVADRTGYIRKYIIDNTELGVTLVATFGKPYRTADTSYDRLGKLYGMAVDSLGNIVFTDRRGEGFGTRLQKIDPNFNSVWQQLSLEFSSSGSYVPGNSKLFISTSRNIYELDKNKGSWKFLGSGKTDADKLYFGNFEKTDFGPSRIVNLNNNTFYYFPCGHRSMAIYKLVPSSDPAFGPTLALVSCLAQAEPCPDGIVRSLPDVGGTYLWSWNDDVGDGKIKYNSVNDPGNVTLEGIPGLPAKWWWAMQSLGVDDQGWIWVASSYRLYGDNIQDPGATIYAIPPRGFNTLGNPIYRWNDAIKVMDEQTVRNTIQWPNGEFNWMMVNRSSKDNIVYGLGFAGKSNWPAKGGAWMGGNILFAFDCDPNTPSQLKLKWRVILPAITVGMYPVENNGVLVGMNLNDDLRSEHGGVVHHYDKNGLLIASFKSDVKFGEENSINWPSGALDCFSALICARDSSDNQVDVFAQDNFNSRILWYRINDADIQNKSGSLTSSVSPNVNKFQVIVNGGIGNGNYSAGSTVNIAAEVPPVNMSFNGWTVVGSGVVLADPLSSNTSFVMPSNSVTLTANYFWTVGNDKVRFYPHPSDERRLEQCIFEGSNDDPINGPYYPFYIVPVSSVKSGWNEVKVDMKNYRYLRMRDIRSNGMVAEIEFYRNNVKIVGVPFGTPGSWLNEANHTFIYALDGDVNTFWNGADAKLVYVGIDSGFVAKHKLNVFSGTGSGDYAKGDAVEILANLPSEGEKFNGWAGDITYLNDPTSSAAIVTMPDMDISLMATYAVIPPPPVQAPFLLSAASRRVHGARGNFDIPVSINEADDIIPIECRNGTNVNLVVTFDKPIESSEVTVIPSVNKKAVLSSVIFNNSIVNINLNTVSDVQLLTVKLKNVKSVDGGVLSSATLRLKILIGDVDGDGVVSIKDRQILEDYFSISVRNFKSDINYTGNITDIDLLSVKNHLGNKLN